MADESERPGGGSPPSPRDPDRTVRSLELHRPRWRDVGWLWRAGWSPELVGRQYHLLETPLQLVIAPARALRAPFTCAAVVEVDRRPAGYIGPNPLSGNLEYFLAPWARGGVGRRLVAAYLGGGWRAGDRPRRFFVSSSNERSLRTLTGALADLGSVEGRDHWVDPVRFGTEVWVGPGGVGGASAVEADLDGVDGRGAELAGEPGEPRTPEG